MSKTLDNLWIQIEGTNGWDKVKGDIKDLVTNPLVCATSLIEYATKERKDDIPGVKGRNEAAWQLVEVALDLLKWVQEKEPGTNPKK